MCVFRVSESVNELRKFYEQECKKKPNKFPTLKTALLMFRFTNSDRRFCSEQDTSVTSPEDWNRPKCLSLIHTGVKAKLSPNNQFDWAPVRDQYGLINGWPWIFAPNLTETEGEGWWRGEETDGMEVETRREWGALWQMLMSHFDMHVSILIYPHHTVAGMKGKRNL